MASEPRVRGAQEGEQVSPVALQPGVAQQRQQRLPERRLAEAQAALERVRDAECCEGRVERRAPAFERRADDRDLVGLGAGAQQREQLLGDELQGPAQARALEEADRPVELRPRASRSGVTKERALQMREWSRARTGVRRQLFAALGERVQVVGGPRERGEGVAPGLVGQRHGHLGTRGQRLQQRPLSAGEVLEAVREDGLGAPGVEVAAYALGRVTPFELAVPESKPVELGAIGRVELTELAFELTRLEQRGLELGHGRPERIREAAEPGRRAQGRRRPGQQRAEGAASAEPRSPPGGARRSLWRAVRRDRRRFRSSRRRARPSGSGARVPPGRRPAGSARSGSDRTRARRDSARAGARPSRRSQALRAG